MGVYGFGGLTVVVDISSAVIKQGALRVDANGRGMARWPLCICGMNCAIPQTVKYINPTCNQSNFALCRPCEIEFERCLIHDHYGNSKRRAIQKKKESSNFHTSHVSVRARIPISHWREGIFLSWIQLQSIMSVASEIPGRVSHQIKCLEVQPFEREHFWPLGRSGIIINCL